MMLSDIVCMYNFCHTVAKQDKVCYLRHCLCTILAIQLQTMTKCRTCDKSVSSHQILATLSMTKCRTCDKSVSSHRIRATLSMRKSPICDKSVSSHLIIATLSMYYFCHTDSNHDKASYLRQKRVKPSTMKALSVYCFRVQFKSI